jgi:hypothetical protein
MPLYLHITAKSQIVLDAAVAEVMKLVDQELGPLIEERTLIARARARGEVLPPGVGQRPKWPEEKLFIGLEPLRNFNVRAKVVGPGVSHLVQALSKLTPGYVRQAHPGGDGCACADQGARVWVPGERDGA